MFLNNIPRHNFIFQQNVTTQPTTYQPKISVLASMNLPAALEDLGGEEVPRSVLQKAEEVRKMGGFDKLNSLMTELPMSLQRNKEILDEVGEGV